MTELLVDVGNKNGDGKRDVIFRLGDKEYPDRFDTGNGFQREQALNRVSTYFGLDKNNLQQLGVDLLRVAKEKDREAEDNDVIGKPFLQRVDTVETEDLIWLWPGKIAIGKLNIISGDPGLGKSLVSLDFTTRVTTGREWPDGTPSGEPGRVILISFEDDLADTIRPRLEAAGADLSRVDFMQGVMAYSPDGDEIVRPFDLRRDMPALEVAIGSGCKMIVIDPISACMGETDSHKNAEVRAALMPLIELAQRRGVAVFGVSHLNKSGGGAAIYRTSGSLAFVAAARSVWLVIKDKADPRNRLFLPAKNNLAPDVEGMSYQVTTDFNGHPVLAWSREPVTMTADEALAPEPKNNSKGARAAKHEEVGNWLRSFLSAGAKSAAEVTEAATALGHSDRAVRAAKDALKVIPVRQGFGSSGTWFWMLPAIDDQEEGISQS